MSYYNPYDDSYDRERRLREEHERQLHWAVQREREDAQYELEQERQRARQLEESMARARHYRMAEIEQEQEGLNQTYDDIRRLELENAELKKILEQHGIQIPKEAH